MQKINTLWLMMKIMMNSLNMIGAALKTATPNVDLKKMMVQYQPIQCTVKF